MQMIERNRRLVKDRPARQRGQIAGCMGSKLRKRLVPAELRHHEVGAIYCRAMAILNRCSGVIR